MTALNLKLSGLTAAAALMLAAPLSAQLASPSTAALGMGDNYTAAARGYSAVSWNPAGLALRGSPGFSLTLGTVRGIAGLDPITLSDLSEWQDRVLPTSVKQQWLASIREEGSQSGNGGGDVTLLGLSVGPFGLQLSSSVRAVSDIAPGIAELLLFGNADDEGNARDISLSGSSMDMNAYTTGAASFALPFMVGDGSRMAVGVTAKYTMGHVLAYGAGSTGSATANPIGVSLSFPIVHTDFGEGAGANNGSGFGLDLGFGYETGMWTLGASVQNVVNTFEWDADLLRYRAGTIVFSENVRETDFDAQDLATAPAGVRGMLDEKKFNPSFAAGAMMEYSPQLTVTADARFGSADGMTTRPPTQVGAGVEYRLMSWLPVRLGAAFVQLDEDNSGMQLGGGLGLRLGGFDIAASAARRSSGLGADAFVMLSLVSFGR